MARYIIAKGKIYAKLMISNLPAVMVRSSLKLLQYCGEILYLLCLKNNLKILIFFIILDYFNKLILKIYFKKNYYLNT